MRANFIYRMFEGELKPRGQRDTSNAEHKELEERIVNETRYFMENLSLEDIRRFLNWEELQNKAAFEDEVDIFSQGFTLGALLMMEIMSGKEALLNE